MRHTSRLAILSSALLVACSSSTPVDVAPLDASETGFDAEARPPDADLNIPPDASNLWPDAETSPDAGEPSVTCKPCLSGDDCAPAGQCMQYHSGSYCARMCAVQTECAPHELCQFGVSFNGVQIRGCVPEGGACGVIPADAGIPRDAGDYCSALIPPDSPSCCSSCTPGVGSCQSNSCTASWVCNSNNCLCQTPSAACAPDGGSGPEDAGATPTGTIGPNGGTANRIYFAVVGDTRPQNKNDTANYPTAVITKIYQDIQAMNPRPLFVIATGDYMFATTKGGQAQPQMQLYTQAAANYTGTIFGALGNHECDGYTADNCDLTNPTQNLTAFLQAMVVPLGKSKPYYTIPISASDGTWTAKVVMTACNTWDATQKTWLAGELAKPSTYTFVVRHEPSSSSETPPCLTDTNALLQSATYSMIVQGHTHTFERGALKEIVVGNGGAPMSNPNSTWGYATVLQDANGFVVTDYDYSTAQKVATFTVGY